MDRLSCYTCQVQFASVWCDLSLKSDVSLTVNNRTAVLLQASQLFESL